MILNRKNIRFKILLYKCIALIFGAFFIIGCSKVVSFTPDRPSPMLNLFFPISMSEAPPIFLSNITSANENPQFLDGARIVVKDFNGNIVLDNFSYTEFVDSVSYYSYTPITWSQDMLYNIEVQRDGYPTVYAQDCLPPFPNTPKLDLEIVALPDTIPDEVDEMWNNVYRCRIKLSDDKTKDLYYGVLFRAVNDTTAKIDTFKTFSLDPLITTKPGALSLTKETLFSNEKLINDYEVVLHFDYKNFFFLEGYRYEMVFTTYSSNGFKYQKSLQNFLNSIGNPFVEEFIPYSNIENGFGAFYGYNSIVIPIIPPVKIKDV